MGPWCETLDPEGVEAVMAARVLRRAAWAAWSGDSGLVVGVLGEDGLWLLGLWAVESANFHRRGPSNDSRGFGTGEIWRLAGGGVLELRKAVKFG